MKKKQALPQAIVNLAKEIVNQTGDGVVGYAEAADAVFENWGQFEEADATVNNIEQINKFLKWAKCEGFCANSPLS